MGYSSYFYAPNTRKWIWDNFFSKLAKISGKAVTKFLDLMIKGLDGLANWIENHPDLFQAIVGGLTAAYAAFQASKIPSLIQGVIRSVMLMGKIFTKISGVFTKFSGIISLLTSPLGIAVVAIGAVVAAGILLYKNWDKIKAFAKKLYKSLSKTIKSCLFYGNDYLAFYEVKSWVKPFMGNMLSDGK